MNVEHPTSNIERRMKNKAKNILSPYWEEGWGEILVI
jgi:hypothetical protein